MIVNKITESNDDIITRWEMTGLLEDIPDEEKASFAHLLHAAALYLSGDDVDAKICALFIPMVRRIYGLNKCVAIKFKVLQLMIESALYWGWKDREKPKINVWQKIIAFFVLSSPSEKIPANVVKKIENAVVEQVCKEYVEKFCKHGNAMSVHDYNCGKLCEHGKGMTDYCLPCNRVNNA